MSYEEQTTTLEVRVNIAERARVGQSRREIAQTLGRPLATVRKWRQRYQRVLRWAFVRYGLPEQISLDHDSAFFDNKRPSPFPSLLHLWLIGLGVQVRFIHKRPLLEHSRIERHHQTIARQAF